MTLTKSIRFFNNKTFEMSENFVKSAADGYIYEIEMDPVTLYLDLINIKGEYPNRKLISAQNVNLKAVVR